MSATTADVRVPDGWTRSEDGSYVRPLVGSELVMRQALVHCDGHGTNTTWLSFTTTIPHIVDAFLEALIQLRLFAPLIAADVRPSATPGGADTWSYTPLASYSSALAWARATLTVHTSPPSDEAFVVRLGEARLPYVLPGGGAQFFGCHLLLRAHAPHAVFVHATHGILDGYTALWALRRLLAGVVRGAVLRAGVAWGAEVARLPVDMLRALDVADARDSTAPAPPQLDTLSVGLLPQRAAVRVVGRAVRATRTLDAPTFARVRGAARTLGLSVTALCEAAAALALARMHAPHAAGAHVVFPLQPVALQRFLRTPYTPAAYMTSCMATVPLFVPAAALCAGPRRAALLGAARAFAAQYAAWLARPAALAAAAGAPVPTANANVCCPAVSNLGEVERFVPRVWEDGHGEGVLEVRGFGNGVRAAVEAGGVVVHVWSFGGVLYLRIQALDTYDVEYLECFLDRVVDALGSVLDEE